MTPPDINLVEMRDAAVSGGHGDVFELDVHVVLGCFIVSDQFDRKGIVFEGIGLVWIGLFGTGGDGW